VLATLDGHPVVVRQGRIVLCAFHPELTDDSRLHALLMALATSSRDLSSSEGPQATRSGP
jgi:pyridoxal 5'-phosphate synthase pdxT subunit